MTKLGFIWAENNGHYIGKNGDLPWVLPNDMKFFKETTKGHPVIMGRKTFDSLRFKPLPKRLNIVLTRDENWTYPDVIVVHSVSELMDYVKTLSDELAFVIGGAGVFDELIDHADYLYQTKVDNDVEGDVKMPEIDFDNYQMKEEIPGVVDEDNIYSHTFYIYEKKN